MKADERVSIHPDGRISIAIRDERFDVALDPWQSTMVGGVSLSMASEDAAKTLVETIWTWPVEKRSELLCSLFDRMDETARRMALESLLLNGHDMERHVASLKAKGLL